MKKRVGAWTSIIGFVGELEDVRSKIILKHYDLIVSWLEKRAGDVESLLRTNYIVTANIESIHNYCTVLPILKCTYRTGY